MRNLPDTMYLNVCRDGLSVRDLKDWSYEYDTRGEEFLEEVGVYQSPNENELFFVIDSGGYGDVIRNIYLAGRLTEITGKYVKIIFHALTETRRGCLDPDLRDTDPKLAKEVVWDMHEDLRLVKDVIKEYEIPDKVRLVFCVQPPKKYIEKKGKMVRQYPVMGENYFIMARIARTMASTQFLGRPWLKPKRESKEGDHIAVWTSQNNLTLPFPWKDPVGWRKTEKYIENLEKEGHKIKRVSYRDDSEYVFETIANAKLCIGYEGMGNLISQMYRKPIIVFSRNDYLSRVNSGFWALVTTEINKSLHDIDKIIKLQKYVINGSINSNRVQPSKDYIEYFGGMDDNLSSTL